MDCINKENILKMDELINSSSQIAIVSHTHPDGDAIGSCMAMATFLNIYKGKNARIVLVNSFAQNLIFIINNDYLEEKEWIPSSDLVICLDFNTFSRTDDLEPLLQNSKATKILIDHHQNPSLECFDLVFSTHEVSSTCELEYLVLKQLLGSIPKNIATPLFLGMTTDTNNFANSTYPSTLSMASDLLSQGVDRDYILAQLYNNYRENRLRAMGYYLSEKMTLLPCGVAYCIFDKETLEKFDIMEGETESFVNMPLAIEKVKYSIFLKEDKGYFRVSIRSKIGYSAARLSAQYFNGGGHENAAGGRLFFPKDIEKPEMAAEYIEINSARFVQQEHNDNE